MPSERNNWATLFFKIFINTYIFNAKIYRVKISFVYCFVYGLNTTIAFVQLKVDAISSCVLLIVFQHNAVTATMSFLSFFSCLHFIRWDLKLQKYTFADRESLPAHSQCEFHIHSTSITNTTSRMYEKHKRQLLF